MLLVEIVLPIRQGNHLLFLAINLICVALILIAAFFALPSDVRELVSDNCRNSRGSLKPRYVVRECFAVAGFYCRTLFAASILAVVVLAVILVLNHFVKIEIIQSALMQADWDIEQWERNLKSAPGNVQVQYLNQHLSNGGTRAGARQTMIMLWHCFPIALAFCFLSFLGLFRILSNSYGQAARDLFKTESARDLRRIRRRYLESTVQAEFFD